ncbi:MAG TPA: ABC transporter substrate-binding protein [Planctomycetota bacterium]|nr:ABC transporter substrate-binding protein [Planctomycetota bacterium]
MGRIYAVVGILVIAIVAFAMLAGFGGLFGKVGGLRLAIDTEPKTLDPIGITDTISDGVARKVHCGLVRLEKDASGTLVPRPDVAEKFDVSPDGKLYTFELRKGVKFHNGREVKAEDAVYSLRRLLSSESKRPDWIKPFVVGSEEYYKDNSKADGLGIKATGEYTLTIELSQPFPPFIQHLCTSNCVVVPKEAVENKDKPFARNPVGVGPFRLTEWRNNEVLVFKRNEDYFRGRPKLAEMRFFIVKEPGTRMAKFFGGELDAADIPNGRVKEAREKAGDENIFEYMTFRTNYIGIGMPNGKFADKEDLKPFGTEKKLRQALAYALDREYLCNTVLEGRAVPAKGVLPPSFPGFKEGRPGWPKDIAKAKALLADAGFPDGKGLPTLTLLHRNDENTKQIVQAMMNDFEKIGVNVELQAREWNRFLEDVDSKPWQAFVLGWVADYPDPDNFLYVLFHSNNWGGNGNHTWYKNEKVDELTTKARSLLEMKDRAPLYQQAEDIIVDECPWIITYHVRNVILLRKNVTGIRDKATPLDTGTEFPQVDFGFVNVE